MLFVLLSKGNYLRHSVPSISEPVKVIPCSKWWKRCEKFQAKIYRCDLHRDGKVTSQYALRSHFVRHESSNGRPNANSLIVAKILGISCRRTRWGIELLNRLAVQGIFVLSIICIIRTIHNL